jgi:predicted esterase
MASASVDQFNVLCLHGCNQTKEMFESILKPLIEIATKYGKDNKITINFHFIEAKYDHPAGGKTWYKRPLEVEKIGSIQMDHDLVDSTLDELDGTIDSLNINVLLGFSQGGNVVDTYLVNAQHNANKIKCAIIMSGYDLVDTNRNTNVLVPVLNVCSDIDTIVPSKFMPIYQNMTVKKHDKGHKLPTSRPFLREIVEFIVPVTVAATVPVPKTKTFVKKDKTVIVTKLDPIKEVPENIITSTD